jgi:pyruvate/2-oxoglutarate dehydrogenase complex dihydrolipoamide dehydrogenase (E3) component
MQAALSARRRGFTVTLLERRATLGGQFSLAFATPGKAEMERPFRSLVRAVTHADVDVRTSINATVDTIRDLKPHYVVLATGSRPTVPPIPGLDRPLTAEPVLSGEQLPGHRVLILGGGLVGIEMAEYLALQGREVVVVELLDDVARDMEPIARKMVLRRLQTRRVSIHTGTRLTRFVDGKAFVRLADADEETSLGRFDSVLVAVGHHPHDPLSEALEATGLPVTVVGDAARPGQVVDATQAAARAVEAIP